MNPNRLIAKAVLIGKHVDGLIASLERTGHTKQEATRLVSEWIDKSLSESKKDSPAPKRKKR